MKKSIFMTLMSLIIPMFMGAQTQITFLYSLDGSYNYGFYTERGIWGEPYVLNNSVQYLNGKYMYPTYIDYSCCDLLSGCLFYETYYDESTNVIGIKKYDEGYQLLENKVIVRNVPQYENYTPNTSLYYVTAKLFNDNNNYEVLISYKLDDEAYSGLGYTERNNIKQKLLLVNENGNVLQDFGTASYLSQSNSICQYKGKWYYSITKYMYEEEPVEGQTYTRTVLKYTTDIYQIEKQSIQGLSQVSPAHMPAYPNPAISEINIPSPNSQEVKIYDMNGRLVDTHNGNDEVVNVNVSGYPSGNYIYQTQGNSGVFIKQ